MFEKLARVIIIFSLLAVLSVTRPARSASQPAIISQLFIPSIMTPIPEPGAWIGLDGGQVISLAIDPQNPNTIYLGTWGAGVFKSVDAGQTWLPARSGLVNMQIVSLAIDPHNSAVVYAGTYKDKLYKSIDSGTTWAQSSNGIQSLAVVYTIAVDPVNSRRVVIGTRGVANICGGVSCPPWAGVLYKTEDGGANWTVLLSQVGGLQNQFWAYSVAIDSLSPNWVQAAYDGAPGIMRSLDAGNTWGPNNTGITNPIGRAIIFDPNSSSTAYYGGWQGHQYPIVFKTTDGGKTWVAKSSGLAGMDILKLAISNANPATLYAGTLVNGLMKSTDGGNNWVGGGISNQQANDIAISPADNQTIYVASNTAGLYKTSNGGLSWASSQHGLILTPATSLQVSPVDWNHLFMGTIGQGVIQSSDQGLTWSSMNAGLLDLSVHALTINPANPNILFALTDTAGLFLYDLAAGGNWIRLPTNALASPGINFPEANQPFGPTYPYTRPEPIDQDVHPERYLDSSARPKQDTPGSSGTAASQAPHLAIVFAPSDPNIAYIGTWGAQVYKTTNNGASWNPTGLPGVVVWSLAVDLTNADLVYAASNAPGSIKFSTTGGSSWSDSPLPSPTLTVYTLSTSFTAPGLLYAGTSNGVYQYTGGKWTSLGLAGRTVTALAANPVLSGYLYAGTTDGAFTSPDGGATWLSRDPQLSHLTIKAISFDPNNIFLVYYATMQSGVLKTQ